MKSKALTLLRGIISERQSSAKRSVWLQYFLQRQPSHEPRCKMAFRMGNYSHALNDVDGARFVTEDFWSTDPEYIEWLDSQEEQDDDSTDRS
jgi:hypothetical protein